MPELKGKTIVIAGDFHFRANSAVDRIVKKINEQDADYVFLLGDYTEKVPKTYVEDAFSKIKAKHGVFSILGNHDYDEINLPNLLVNSHIDIDGIRIAGVEFYKPDIYKAIGESELPTILLSHQPDIYKRVPPQVELMISGHTHGGQITLFGKPLWNPSKNGYIKGEYHNGRLIITSGVGNSIIPARLFCPPEITVLK